MGAGSGLPHEQGRIVEPQRRSLVPRFTLWPALVVLAAMVAVALARRLKGGRHRADAVASGHTHPADHAETKSTASTSEPQESDHAPQPDVVLAAEEAAERSSWTWPWPPEDPTIGV